MDRDEALKLLRGGPEGVAEWNRLLEGGEEIPDLEDAFLINSDLRAADLRGAFLVGVSFYHADLRGADLVSAQLSRADFRGADLRGTALRHANLSGAFFGGTLISCDLSKAGGLESVVHLSRSIVDVHCLLFFRGKLPEGFFRGCGLPQEEIDHFRDRIRRGIELHSCFICHSADDEAFASRLHSDFQSAGLRCWKWNHDARMCEELLNDPDLPVSVHDKIVLVLSRHSLMSESVNREIDRVIEDENRRDALRQKGMFEQPPEILYPVRVDNFVFEQAEDGRPLWDHPRRDAVVNRPIADGVGWEKNQAKYEQVRGGLIRALKAGR
ncbi:MAG: toll/interleukin-1 receptor domain-containing protein [Phycisphaerae bacterium]|nr:toll/interleukin-1 receptor domain-containing protein [Phycisphaerae bacterium]